MNTAALANKSAGHVSSDAVMALQLVGRLHGRQATLLPDLAVAASQLIGSAGWKAFGFANAQDFSRERLDRSGRWLRNLASLAEPFGQFPAFLHAATGHDGHHALGRSPAFEIARVATACDIQHWIARARLLPIRALKLEVQLALSATRNGELVETASGGLSPSAGQRQTVEMALPGFVAHAMDELEEVYKASNAAATRAEFVDHTIAEYRTSLPVSAGTTAIDQAPHCIASNSIVDPGSAAAISSTRHGISLSLGSCAEHCEDVQLDDRMVSSHRSILLARWTLHRSRCVGEATVGDATAADSNGTNQTEIAFCQLQELLALENEIELRISQLLLHIEKQGSWAALGYKHATEFAVTRMQQSASTTRGWLRTARAMEVSPALNKACESGFSHQRALRLLGLIDPATPNEPAVRRWIDHARQITIKRLDDEIRNLVGKDSSSTWPNPPSDDAWFGSIRRAPGDARALLMEESVAALSSSPAADVFLRLNLPVEIATELRMCIREALESLQVLSAHAAVSSPAEEARQRPSTRFALAYMGKKKPLPPWLGLLAILEEFAEQWDNPQLIHKRPTDHITNRDGWRCTAPGCTARSLEVHHIVYQSRGGSDAPANLTSLCPFHHRMGEHGTLSSVTGEAPLQLHWRLGAGNSSVEFQNESWINR